MKLSTLLILLSSSAFADTGFKDLIRFREVDGSPSCMAGQVNVSAGTLTCSGNIATLVTGGGSGGGGYIGFYLKDSALNAWYITVNPTGHLVTTQVGSTTTGTLYRTSFGLKDSAGSVWLVSINTSGNLITNSGGAYSQAVNDVLINDSNNFTWIVSVNTSGNLVTS